MCDLPHRVHYMRQCLRLYRVQGRLWQPRIRLGQRVVRSLQCHAILCRRDRHVPQLPIRMRDVHQCGRVCPGDLRAVKPWDVQLWMVP